MATFALDVVSGDLSFSNGRAVIISGAAEKAQKIKNRLSLFLGEWFIDTRVGMPWYQTVLVKNPNLQIIQQLFRSVILGVEGIAYVEAVEVIYDPALRTLSYTFAAIDDDGVKISGGSGQSFIVGVE